MNNGGGATCRVTMADGLDTSDDETIEGTLEDRTVDACELSVTMGFGETDDLTGIAGKRTETSTYVGAGKSVSDTCLSYVFQVRSNKPKATTIGAKL